MIGAAGLDPGLGMYAKQQCGFVCREAMQQKEHARSGIQSRSQPGKALLASTAGRRPPPATDPELEQKAEPPMEEPDFVSSTKLDACAEQLLRSLQ